MRYRLTQHALEQATLMDVDRDEVVDCIERPDSSWPSKRLDAENVTVARNARLTIPYNHVTGEVITVLWTSTEWLPDRHLAPEEQPVSGWINLDAKEGERLLEAWGFIVKEDKGTTKLWTYPADPEQRMIPFVAPGTRRANGRSSWRSAAAAVGVSVPVLLKGPNAGTRVSAAAASELYKTFDESTPDPLGIREARKAAALQKADKALSHGDKIRALTPTARAAYEAVDGGEPLSAAEIAHLIERGKTVTNDVLNQLVNAELVVSRMSEPGEFDVGRPRLLYLAGPPGTEVPSRIQPLPDPAPAPVVVDDLPEEAPVNPVSQLPTADPVAACVEPIVVDPTPSSFSPQLFQRTEIKWPTGGIVIQDDEGNLYVARPLVEGR